MFERSFVVELTDNDFVISKSRRSSVVRMKKNGKNKSFGYVLVYAPWCHFCQEKELMWKDLANQFHKKRTDFGIYVINSESNTARKIVSALKIEGFPTFFHLGEDGSIEMYNAESTDLDSLMREASKHIRRTVLSALPSTGTGRGIRKNKKE